MGAHTFTASIRVPTAWSTTALPLGVGVDTTVGSAPGLASKVTEWAGKAATNEAASNVALAAFNAPAFIQYDLRHDQECTLSGIGTSRELANARPLLQSTGRSCGRRQKSISKQLLIVFWVICGQPTARQGSRVLR